MCVTCAGVPCVDDEGHEPPPIGLSVQAAITRGVCVRVLCCVYRPLWCFGEGIVCPSALLVSSSFFFAVRPSRVYGVVVPTSRSVRKSKNACVGCDSSPRLALPFCVASRNLPARLTR